MTKPLAELPMARAFEVVLDGELGGPKAREVMQTVADRYDDLYAERKRYENGALARHLQDSLLPGIALYQALLEDPETQQRSMDLVEAAFGEWAASRRKALEPLARRSIFYLLMRFTTKFVTSRSYPDEGWEIEWLEVNGDVIAYNVNHCFYLEVLLEYGVPELTAQYCRVDDLIYDGLSPHAKWVRKKTLGRGDDCCDFRFERVR